VFDSTTEPALESPEPSPGPSKHHEGERIGKYTLVRELGRGGMGEVWEASSSADHPTVVALKLMHGEHASSENLRSRFMREARLLANVQHPNVVGILDVFATRDGGLVLAMERLRGESLRQRIDRAGRLTIEETSALLEQLLRALAAIHGKGVVHRDLKPDNLFLVETDGGLPPSVDVRVLDFGIASAERIAGRTLTDLTQSGAIVGTPAYMAPEQLFGEAADARSDLWSAGIVAYTCLTGKCPTEDDALGGVIRRVTKDPIAAIRTQRPDVSEAVASFLDAVLHKERDQRPASAEACLEIVQGLRPHHDVTVALPRPPGALAQTQPLPILIAKKRSAARFGVPIAIVALLVVGIVAVTRKSTPPSASPPVGVVSAPPPPPSVLSPEPPSTSNLTTAAPSLPSASASVAHRRTNIRAAPSKPASKPAAAAASSSSSTAPGVEDIVLGK